MQSSIASYQASQKRLTDRDGRSLPGYLAEPPNQATGAIVIVHDFFGLTPAIKATANRFVTEGFVAFAPDLYRGAIATTRDEAIELAKRLAWNQVAVELGLVVGALKSARPNVRVGIMGFAMGGAAALVAAAAVHEISAAVTFYGIPQDVTLENPNVPVQGHFASHDPKCTPDRVDALEQMLRERNIRADLHRYDANNGFFNPTRADAYVKVHADAAWASTLRFLKSTLA